MLDEREIDIEIARLEYIESSYPNYSKLADLYIIRDQMKRAQQPQQEQGYSRSASPAELVTANGDSDFMRAADGKNANDLLQIFDRLLDSIKIVNSRLYESTINRIRQL